MPLQATSGAASYDAFGGGVPAEPNYIESCFSTWLYTGNGSTQTITNGIDLAGKGGLYWWKVRNIADQNILVDTTRGANKYLLSNSAGAEQTTSAYNFAFNSNGVSFNNNFQEMNQSGNTYASWTFREQPKFFDVVTWTGDGTNPRQISHNLGSVPGCIIVKSTTRAENWTVYHRSLGNTGRIALNTTAAAVTGTGVWASTTPTSTTFTVSADNLVNFSGDGYVAYLFAHNAGGFGLTGTDNVISCGSFTTDGSGNATVDLGYEPQWVLNKTSSSADNWTIADNMRGFSVTNEQRLYANLSNVEAAATTFRPTATGYTVNGGEVSKTYIYIAIRRGPMKVPTTGTSVFAPVQYTTSPEGFITGFPVDFGIAGNKSGTDKWYWQSRLQGAVLLNSASTAAEVGSGSAKFDMMNGYGTGFSTSYWTDAFRRAPGFFDVVCYTGTGSATTFAHNLAVVPELMIVKSRSNTGLWAVYSSALGNSALVALNRTDAETTGDSSWWNATTPTASLFSIGNQGTINTSGSTYVAYLFATCPGVSKVGSYTGNGSSQTINCGFTGGARFVLIKRTDSTGNWMVVDTARGLVSAGDPTLYLNSTAAEVTGVDWLDPDSSGFIVNQESTMNANVNGGTYIYLSIA